MEGRGGGRIIRHRSRCATRVDQRATDVARDLRSLESRAVGDDVLDPPERGDKGGGGTQRTAHLDVEH